MTEESPKILPNQPNTWEEPRIVVFLIGLCLLLEGGLIYYQAGSDQMIVASITGLSGLTLLIFAYLVPLQDEPEISETESPQPTTIPNEQLKIVSPPSSESISTGVAQQVIEVPAEAPSDQPPPVTIVAIPVEQVQVQPTPESLAPLPEEEVGPVLSWFERLKIGLKKTREGFVGKLKKLVFGKTVIDDDLLDEIEGALFEADIGVKTTQELLAVIHKRVEEEEIKDPNVIYTILKDQLKARLDRFSSEPRFNKEGLSVFLIIGVNGVGKTTTIAKLARKYVKEGKKVILAAGDTFRAAAIDQLRIWGDRVGVEVIRGAEGGDPGALVFDSIHAARKRSANLLIVDTAGRMHVKVNLMDELKKVKKIIEKEADGGPNEILLVLDATTGQNAVQQAKLFNEALPISGLIMTKLDGTAKGGVLFAVEEQITAPVKFIGVGEKMDDLMVFDPAQFLEALFLDDTDKTKKSDYQVM